MADTAPQPQPIQLHVPPSLKPYTTPLSKFLTNNPLYTSLAVSAIILSPLSSSYSSTLSSTCSHHQPSPSHSTTTQQHPHPEAATVTAPGEKEPRRILLLRRAPTEHSFPNKWELPGGSSEASDPTVLHSVAREVFEETGLRVNRFVREVGIGAAAAEGDTGSKAGMQKMDFTTGKGQGEKVWAKRVFEVEVVEQGVKQDGEGEKEGGEMEVQLDQEEHAEFKWATSEEVGMLSGEMVSEAVYRVVMEGFEGAG